MELNEQMRMVTSMANSGYWPVNSVVSVRPQSAQDEIDSAVREALEKPKREAEEQRRKDEIQRRVEASKKIGTEDRHETGTVLRWIRKHDQKDLLYVAIKAENGKWYVTHMTKHSGLTWDELLQWMITGENMIESLEIVSVWNPVL